jgi:hypothetical protein
MSSDFTVGQWARTPVELSGNTNDPNGIHAIEEHADDPYSEPAGTG